MKCSKCKQDKPTTEFWVDNSRPSGFKTWCRSCSKQAVRPEAAREATLRWRRNNPEAAKWTQIKSLYGLSIDQYNQLLTKQNNGCAICKQPFEGKPGSARAPCVDHCHTSGKVRALLCTGCNKMIGYAKDNAATLRNAAKYVNKYMAS